MFTLLTGTPAENEMQFCPYCGAALSSTVPAITEQTGGTHAG
jgi:hypothetical protein